MVEEAVITALKAIAGVSAIVGTKVRWGEADSAWTPPYIICHTVSDESIESHSGPGGLALQAVQINCVAQDTTTEIGYDDARDIVEAIKTGFGNFSGTSNGTTIVVIERLNTYPVPTTAVGGAEASIVTVAVEYLIGYTDVIPA